ncbi:MAG TPA: hypothetical protein VHN16_17175 [Streptosporangiaceae bacterium]|nr:hypothetical protein [Streptosporangiaceae bacterium]
MNWQQVAEVLNGFSPDDILRHLALLSSEQRRSVHAGALANRNVGPDSRIAQLTEDSMSATSVNARYFTADNFGGRFDGIVDPAAGTVTLVARVKIEFADGLRFGLALPGTSGWEQETHEGKGRFKADFKAAIERTWSGKGVVRPKCPIGGVGSLQTKAVVVIVDGDPHVTFTVANLGPVPSAVSGAEGQLDVQANVPKARIGQVADPTGKTPVQTTTTQITSAHEFGHAIGLADLRFYGVTEEQRRDVMGAGDLLQVLKRGGAVIHDDFLPFERIAERWGRDVAAPRQAGCNVWTAMP